jgi:hypothetical protein
MKDEKVREEDRECVCGRDSIFDLRVNFRCCRPTSIVSEARSVSQHALFSREVQIVASPYLALEVQCKFSIPLALQLVTESEKTKAS